MTRTIELRKMIQNKLKEYCDRVYAMRSDVEDITEKHIVYELSEASYAYHRINYQLEVDVFDYGTDTAAAEMLADEIQKGMDGWNYLDEKLQFSCYRGLRNNVVEENKDIIRKRLLFELHLYE